MLQIHQLITIFLCNKEVTWLVIAVAPPSASYQSNTRAALSQSMREPGSQRHCVAVFAVMNATLPSARLRGSGRVGLLACPDRRPEVTVGWSRHRRPATLFDCMNGRPTLIPLAKVPSRAARRARRLSRSAAAASRRHPAQAEGPELPHGSTPSSGQRPRRAGAANEPLMCLS